jgi:hypothetical protein
MSINVSFIVAKDVQPRGFERSINPVATDFKATAREFADSLGFNRSDDTRDFMLNNLFPNASLVPGPTVEVSADQRKSVNIDNKNAFAVILGTQVGNTRFFTVVLSTVTFGGSPNPSIPLPGNTARIDLSGDFVNGTVLTLTSLVQPPAASNARVLTWLVPMPTL